MNVLPYLAGIVDGDGCITIQRKKTAPEHSSKGYVYDLVLGITQPEPEAIMLAHQTFGGCILHRLPTQDSTHKVYYWKTNSKNASEAIEKLKPYLRVRRHQANVALGLYDIQRTRRGGNGVKYTDIQWASMDELYRQLWNDMPLVLPDDAPLAYFAGLIDSDGYVAVQNLPSGDGWTPIIAVTQVSNLAVSLAHRKFGGDLHISRRTHPHSNIYTWRVASNKAVLTARQLYPYLRIKKDRAQNILNYAKIRDVRPRGRGKGYTPSQRRALERCTVTKPKVRC